MEDASMKTFVLSACMFATACATTVEPASVPLDSDDDDPAMMPDGGMGSSDEPDQPTVAPIRLVPSVVRDERGDSIDFTTGQPVHTHNGGAVDLGSPGCPAVYKYSYLMDVDTPYGEARTDNPLAWNIQLASPGLAGGARFRVRTSTDLVLLDWSVLPPVDTNAMATIELTRAGGQYNVPKLATGGQFFLDVRVRDATGHETIASWCWDHHPLAAPVEVEPLERGDLFSINLPANTPAAALVSNGSVGLVSQTITQYVTEPTTVTWSAGTGAITYARSTFDGYVSEEKAESLFCLAGSTDPKCAMTWAGPATAGMVAKSGTVTPSLSIHVIDAATNQTIQTTSATGSPSISVALPARALGQPPRAYRFALRAASIAELSPAAMGTAIGEYSLFGLQYTGEAAQSMGVHCAHAVQTQWGPQCQRVAYHYRFSALDSATLRMSVLARVEQGGIVASYVPAASLASGTVVWESGDDDLPGTY
jgi:hypothetical protein